MSSYLPVHRTGIAEVTGSNPVEALIFFFQASSFQLLKLKIYCDDHPSLSMQLIVSSHANCVIESLLLKKDCPNCK